MIDHNENDAKCKCLSCKEDRKNAKKIAVTNSTRNADGTTTTRFSDGTNHTTRKSFNWND